MDDGLNRAACLTVTNGSSDKTQINQKSAHLVNVSSFESDIGRVINATMSAAAVTKAVHAMSDEQKYHLLKNHDKPPNSFIFPVT